MRMLRALVLCTGLLVYAHTAEAAVGVVFQTSVRPEADEDIAAPCGYELTLLDPARPVKAVWVTFDRGRDMLRYYGDPDVQSFASRHDMALLLAFHCRAKSGEDMNMDPAKGLGRALFTALAQFADQARHPELSSAKAILLGFSGTGALVARFPGYAADRVLAVVSTGPGHSDPQGMDTISLPAAASKIPQLIVSGGADGVSGTTRPYAYFRRHFDQGAPWTFITQNSTPHCCIINAKGLVLEWLDAVVIHQAKPDAGWWGFIRTAPARADDCPDPRPPTATAWCRSTKDIWGDPNWSVSDSSIHRGRTAADGWQPAGWLPSRRFADGWQAFVKQPEHAITSLP